MFLGKEKHMKDIYFWMGKVAKSSFKVMSNFPRRSYEREERDNLDEFGFYPNAMLHIQSSAAKWYKVEFLKDKLIDLTIIRLLFCGKLAEQQSAYDKQFLLYSLVFTSFDFHIVGNGIDVGVDSKW